METDPGRGCTSDLATSLHNLGAHLNAVGRNTEALQISQEAVALRLTLGETDPVAAKDLAPALHGLGVHLSAAGRESDALHRHEEAVQLRRKLASQDPRATKSLALSLNTLGKQLRVVGHHGDALHADEEAVDLHRKLVAADPGITSELCQSLEHLALLGGISRKLAVTEAAVKIALPISLAMLAKSLREARCYEDALRIDEEAVELLRETTETDSPSSAELSTALARLALDLMAVGCYDEALHVGEERRSTPSDDLTCAIYMLGVHMHELGREDALLTCEEAVELRRNVQETGAMPVLSLANSLENLGVFLRALGRHEDSLGITQEAVDLQRRLIATAPDLTLFLINSPKNLIMGSFAHSLENLAFSHSAVGNAEDAVRAAGESVDIYRSLPDRTAELEVGLASALCSLAAFLRAVDRQEDALRADKEGAES
ncbi:hypothetical protein B0H13DRAFT_2120181, partial [Mycena leptocephala]